MTAVDSASFVYDGDGNRVKKTESSETIIYVNRYYEKNTTTGDVTTYYYLGGKLVANRVNTTLTYVHQDSLSSTSVVITSSGTLESICTYYPFGGTRTGGVSTDQKFTGQRLDSTGLYYYGARYYAPEIGRFASPDGVTPDLMNPQSLNKYSYCFNNPLKYNDPTGHWPNWSKIGQTIVSGVKAAVNAIKADPIGALQTILDVAGMIPVIGEVCDVASGVISLARGDMVGAGLSLMSAIPVVGSIAGGAKIVKNVVKTVDKVVDASKAVDTATDIGKTILKKADDVADVTRSPLKHGQEMHKNYMVTEALAGLGKKEFRLPSGKRIDFLDVDNSIIYELKPNNPRSIASGQRQLQSYLDEIQSIPKFQGTNWSTVLDLY